MKLLNIGLMLKHFTGYLLSKPIWIEILLYLQKLNSNYSLQDCVQYSREF